MMSNAPIDIRSVNTEDLSTYLQESGYPGYTTGQIQDWLYKKGITSFLEMSNLSKKLRNQLADDFVITLPEIEKYQKSVDGTIKVGIKLHDGHLIEAVLIPAVEDNRYTVCVSSQVGCSLSCSFCATGQMNLARNLTAHEIFDQVRLVNDISVKEYGHSITNIVYMGMGEPLLNYREVMGSIDLIIQSEAWNITPKKITISTAGIAKMIMKLADSGVKVNLALSLHAADDEKRNTVMEINETNSLDKLQDALSYFYTNTKSKITYEYILFRDFNDTRQDANNLVKLCKNYPVKINIIEYNTVKGVDFEKSPEDVLDRFVAQLGQHQVYASVRRSRGKDIDAACGQLANN